MFDKIKEANLENKLVVFIGAGISANSGYKSWQDLIREMDYFIKYSDNPHAKYYDNDELLRIPQYLKNTNEDEYTKILKDCFEALPNQTNQIINAILDLKPHHIITTNFDHLIEYSIEELFKDFVKGRKINNYAIVKKDQDIISINKSNLVIKMHGDIEDIESMVLKEDDYLNYSLKHSLIETFIKSLLIDHSFLFLGYKLGDYNLKLIMNWFESIISSYKIERSGRKYHFFVNSEDKPVSEFDKVYFESKNIQVIDSANLPEKFRYMDIDTIRDSRGKNIYRTLNYILNGEATARSISYVYKKLLPFAYSDKLVFQDILKVLNEDSFIYKQIGNELYIYLPIKDKGSAIGIAIKSLQSSEDTIEELYIKDTFTKAGINKVVQYEDNMNFEFCTGLTDSEMYLAIIEKDFVKVYQYIIENTFDEFKTLYLKLFVGDAEGAEQSLKEIKEKNLFKSPIDQIIFMRNSRYCNITNSFSYQEIIEVLSIEEKKYISTLCDFINNFNDIFAELATESMKIKEKYSIYNKGTICERGVENSNFKRIATQIINTMKYFVYNGLYTFGCCFFSIDMQGYSNLLELYIDTLFFLQSSECNQAKYENIKMSKDDMIIISSYIKPDDLRLMINRYNIKKLCIDNECIEYLLRSLKNVVDEQKRRSYEHDRVAQYLSKVAITICELIILCDLSMENIIIFTDVACSVLCITDGNISDYNYVILKELYSKMLGMTVYFVWRKYDKRLVSIIENTFLTIIRAFNAEDHSKCFSKFYKKYIEEYRTLLNLCNVLSKHNVMIEDSDLDMFVNICLQYSWYEESLIDVYGVCCEDSKQRIKTYASSKVKQLSPFYIYVALEKEILEYNQDIENYLIHLCEQVVKAQNIADSGYWDSSLYVVLRLKEKGIIKSLEKYRQFAEKNYFFNYVCFPNDFDYTNYNIEWYSWLDYKEYADAACNAKEILKEKYKEAIDKGAPENIKATYYRFFFEIEMSDLND